MSEPRDWNEWRNNLAPDEIDAALADPGPPWVEGTCYPMKRFVLLHTIDPRVLEGIPNPFRRTERET